MDLNHTLVPSKDKMAAAEHFAEIMGLEVGTIGHFAPVRISETFIMDFADVDDVTLWENEGGHITRNHYAFHVNDEEFDSIFTRIQENRLIYGSGPGPNALYDMQIGQRRDGRCIYWDDLNSHSMELFTNDAG